MGVPFTKRVEGEVFKHTHANGKRKRGKGYFDTYRQGGFRHDTWKERMGSKVGRERHIYSISGLW